MFRGGRCQRAVSHVTCCRAVSSWWGERASTGLVGDVMRVFVAGGTGVIGRRLVPQLVARGHEVTATTTSAGKLGLLEQLGAEGVVMDGLDAGSVGEAVAAARPDTIVHEMTALSLMRTGRPSLRHPDRWIATTTRLRAEGTDHLLAAAEATGVSHIVAQSVAGSFGKPKGGWMTEEEQQPLEEMGQKMRQAAEALRHVEDVVVKAGCVALRWRGRSRRQHLRSSEGCRGLRDRRSDPRPC